MLPRPIAIAPRHALHEGQRALRGRPARAPPEPYYDDYRPEQVRDEPANEEEAHQATFLRFAPHRARMRRRAWRHHFVLQ